MKSKSWMLIGPSNSTIFFQRDLSLTRGYWSNQKRSARYDSKPRWRAHNIEMMIWDDLGCVVECSHKRSRESFFRSCALVLQCAQMMWNKELFSLWLTKVLILLAKSREVSFPPSLISHILIFYSSLLYSLFQFFLSICFFDLISLEFTPPI